MARRLLAWGPYLVLAAAGLLVLARWDAWPRSYPAHWGLHGPDRFTQLSPRAVLGPLAVGALFVAWLAALRADLLANSDPAADGGRSQRAVAATLTAAQWGIAAVFAAVAVPRQTPLLILAAAAASLVLVVAALAVSAGGRGVPAPRARPAPPGGWLYVPKRRGVGLTIAAGHPRARRAWSLALVAPILLTVVSIALLP